MALLAPCPSCARHVRRSEAACPFCASALVFGPAPAPRLPDGRIGRAAIVFGAAVSLAGCSNAVPAYGAPIPDTGTASQDAATSPDTGASPSDAGNDAASSAADAGNDAASEADAWALDAGGASSDYGAPPAP